MKIIGKYIAFFAILLGLIILACYIFTPFNYDPKSVHKDIAKGWLGEGENSLDYVVLGDSASYTTFRPVMIERKTGKKGFVCGRSGGRLFEMYRVLQEVMETQDLEAVVVETNTMYQFSSTAGEFKKAVVDAAYGLMPFFEYHGRWKYLTPEVLAGKTGTTSVTKGYRVFSEAVPYEGGEYMIPTEERAYFSPIFKYYLDKIKELCDENGMEMYMISTPSAKNCNYAKHNTIQDWCTENEVPFIDMNLVVDEVGINWKKDTFDGGDHLNRFGAKKVSRYLAKHYLSDFAQEQK